MLEVLFGSSLITFLYVCLRVWLWVSLSPSRLCQQWMTYKKNLSGGHGRGGYEHGCGVGFEDKFIMLFIDDELVYPHNEEEQCMYTLW